MNRNTNLGMWAAVLDTMERTGRPMSTLEIGDAIGRSRVAVIDLLWRMEREGYVVHSKKTERGGSGKLGLCWEPKGRKLAAKPEYPPSAQAMRYDCRALLEALGMNVTPPAPVGARQHIGA